MREPADLVGRQGAVVAEVPSVKCCQLPSWSSVQVWAVAGCIEPVGVAVEQIAGAAAPGLPADPAERIERDRQIQAAGHAGM